MSARSGPERIAELVASLEPLTDTRLAPAKELVQAVLELHGRGLAALMKIIGEQGAAGGAILDACTRDREVAALLLLHDLHPVPLDARVEQALAVARRDLAVHKLDVRLIGVDDGVVRLKLEGSGGRGVSVPQLKADVEAAMLELAPEIAGVEFEGLDGSGEVAFVPISGLKKNAAASEEAHGR